MKIGKIIRPGLVLLSLLLIGGVLRFWNLEGLTTFSGDQGYDFQVVKKMILERDFTLLGPKIGPYNSVGNLYLGPAYYYLLAPSLLLFKLDPVGPAAFTVVLSILTIYGVYKFSQKYFSKETAWLSGLFYSLNSFLINQSRAPSNPHLIPFFSIIYLYALFEAISSKANKLIWPIIAGLSLGIMVQLHYLSVSLAPLLVVFLLKKKIKQLVCLVTAFFVAVSPQILFEIRNQFFISNLFIKQMKSGGNLSNGAIFLDHLQTSFTKLSTIFLPGKAFLFFALFFLTLALIVFFKKSRSQFNTILLLTASVISILVLTSLYSGNIELHYFAPVYPSIVLLMSAGMIFIFKFFRLFAIRLLVLFLIFQIISANILSLNLKSQQGYTMPNGWNLKGTKKASKIIANDVTVSKFNIASVLDGDTRAQPFRYLVEVYGKVPQAVEHYPDSQVIYLISPDEEDKIKRYTVWEVSSFLPYDIEKSWEIQNGIKLYKLKKDYK